MMPRVLRRAALVLAATAAVLAGAEARPVAATPGTATGLRPSPGPPVAMSAVGIVARGASRGCASLAFAPLRVRRAADGTAAAPGGAGGGVVRHDLETVATKAAGVAAAEGQAEGAGAGTVMVPLQRGLDRVEVVHGSVAAEKSPVRRSLIVLASVMFVVGAALAAAETAITTLWPWKVRELAEKEGVSSPFAVLQADLTRFLTTILVTTTSATVLSTAIATDVAGDVFGAAAVGYVTAGMTVFFLFFGEILPKALAVHAPAKVARVMVPVISTLSVIVYPVGKLLAWVSTQILRLLKLPMESDATVSEGELRLIVAGADRSGSIEKYESQIIQNVLDLEDTDVREVMCPRVDVVALPDTNDLSQLLELESQSRYSRMPVYEGTIDNIVGVAMAKSLLRYLNGDAMLLQSTKVSEIMDPAFFVPESMSVWIVLEEMRKRRLHMAIVVDEYGGTAGLVTLEDILEEVVGEIYDEDDDYEAQAQLIDVGDDGCCMLDGQADLDKVGQTLKLNLSEEDLDAYGTISGFLCAQMEGIPDVGDEVVFSRVRFTVSEADDRRIIAVRAETLSDEELRRIADEKKAVEEKAASYLPRLEAAPRDGGYEGNGSKRKDGPVSPNAPDNGHSEDSRRGKLSNGAVGKGGSDGSIREALNENDTRNNRTPRSMRSSQSSEADNGQSKS